MAFTGRALILAQVPLTFVAGEAAAGEIALDSMDLRNIIVEFRPEGRK